MRKTVEMDKKHIGHIGFLKEKANWVRKEVVDICVANGAGHIAPSLSCVDILVALYYSVMNIRFSWDNRDRLVFSKAHGCYGLYAILYDLKLIPEKEWKYFYKEGKSSLLGCAERNVSYGIEAGCGSLGHGLPMAVGIAFGAKLQRKKYRVYCVVGDGEMQEGSCWEAVQFAAKHKLSNLVVIIDANRLQAMDFLEKIMTIEGKGCMDLFEKFSTFGFEAKMCDGHNIPDMLDVFELIKSRSKKDKPQVLIAHTVKGRGLTCMENVPKFHFRIPTEEELQKGRSY